MAKELTFEQVKRNCSAIQLNQRLVAAGAGFVDCVSDELFASSSFSVNEHGRIRRCNSLHLLQDDFQGRTAANDLLKSAAPTVLINHSHSFGSQSLRELILKRGSD